MTPAEIRAARVLMGLSLRGAADMLGIPENHVRQLENPRSRILSSQHVDVLRTAYEGWRSACVIIEKRFAMRPAPRLWLPACTSREDLDFIAGPDISIRLSSPEMMLTAADQARMALQRTRMVPVRLIHFDADSFARFENRTGDIIADFNRWADAQAASIRYTAQSGAKEET